MNKKPTVKIGDVVTDFAIDPGKKTVTFKLRITEIEIEYEGKIALCEATDLYVAQECDACIGYRDCHAREKFKVASTK